MQFLVIGDSGSGKTTILQTISDGSSTGICELLLLYYVFCLIDSKIEFITKKIYLNEENRNITLHIHTTTTTSNYKDAMV